MKPRLFKKKPRPLGRNKRRRTAALGEDAEVEEWMIGTPTEADKK